jgi:serine/threonine-protein kinase PknK
MPLLDEPVENDPTETYPTEKDPTENLLAHAALSDDPGRAGRESDIPGYHVMRPIGRGGFSVVYRARQVALDRDVALKVVTVALDENVRRRFLREVALIGKLAGHPNVVNALDAGDTNSGRSYLAMELYEGGSLADRLRREGRIPAVEVAQVGARMASALAAAHERGIVHRDVKPSNILVSQFGEPALADFGVACLLDDNVSRTVLGTFTLRHAAPEVINGTRPNSSSDVYALGSTMYELLTGRPAFGGEDVEIVALLMQILSREPAAIDCPELPGLVDVIRRAMAKKAADRHASAAEMEDALWAVLDGSPNGAVAPPEAAAGTNTAGLPQDGVAITIGSQSTGAAGTGEDTPDSSTKENATGPEPLPGPRHQRRDTASKRSRVPAQRGRRRKPPKLVTLGALAVLFLAGVAGANIWKRHADQASTGGLAAGTQTSEEPSATPDHSSAKPSASKSPSPSPSASKSSPADDENSAPAEPSDSPSAKPTPTGVPSEEPPSGAVSVCAPGCRTQVYFVSLGEHLFVCDNDAGDGNTTAAEFIADDIAGTAIARNTQNPGRCADHDLDLTEFSGIAFRACLSDDTGRLFGCSETVTAEA